MRWSDFSLFEELCGVVGSRYRSACVVLVACPGLLVGGCGVGELEADLELTRGAQSTVELRTDRERGLRSCRGAEIRGQDRPESVSGDGVAEELWASVRRVEECRTGECCVSVEVRASADQAPGDYRIHLRVELSVENESSGNVRDQATEGRVNVTVIAP